ncbi:MAG TPA: wax ester/triacylglycerol synthase family O-acyltransferase [Thermoleophilaceae bacterium]|jgi:WS/DGAT/MGAT family acyltransferase
MAEDRLTGLDASFLHIESDNSHMHVAGVMLFEGSPPPHDELVEALERKMHLVPRYRQKLAFVPLQQGRPRWVDDPHFNLDYHVRTTALPPPGSEEQLRNLAGRVFSQQLDRDKPLWEMWIVEGLGGGERFAVLSKTHHALVDGISGVDIASVLFDVSPDPAPIPDPPRRWLPRPLPSRGQLLAEALIERATVPAEIVRGVRSAFRAPRRIAGAAVGALAGVGAMAWAGMSPAPPSPYNTSIGPHRRFTWARCSLADVKAIKNSLGGTVNDVMLAVVTRALRRDLRRRGVDVEGLELTAMVPVSVRSDEARGALGNQVAAMMAPLPVGIEDPVACLQAISRAMQRVKDSGQAVGAQMLTELTGFAPPTIMGQASRLVVRQRFFNLVVTNVPGPQIPLYMMGRKMIELFPMVPLAPNQALGVAIMSYNGRINFGLVGDYDVMADLDQLARDFQAALAELAEAAGVELTAPEEPARAARNGSRPARRVGAATVSAAAPRAGGAAPPAPPPA